VPYPISGSVWLANGSLVVATGHQMHIFGSPRPTPGSRTRSESLFEYAARHNGALQEYHPQMLLQCLLWGAVLSTSNSHECVWPDEAEKIELVKEIIVKLAHDVKAGRANDIKNWNSIPLERFLRKDPVKLVRRQVFPPNLSYHCFRLMPQTKGTTDIAPSLRIVTRWTSRYLFVSVCDVNTTQISAV
jgi:RAVE protein 1 C terminal